MDGPSYHVLVMYYQWMDTSSDGAVHGTIVYPACTRYPTGLHPGAYQLLRVLYRPHTPWVEGPGRPPSTPPLEALLYTFPEGCCSGYSRSVPSYDATKGEVQTYTHYVQNGTERVRNRYALEHVCTSTVLVRYPEYVPMVAYLPGTLLDRCGTAAHSVHTTVIPWYPGYEG